MPEGARLVAGQWWPADYRGPQLVSFDAELAGAFGIGVGDTITVNVLGRNITARISNMRTVDWESLGINFVLVFSPGAFAGAPATDIATVTWPGGGSAADPTPPPTANTITVTITSAGASPRNFTVPRGGQVT